MPGARSNRSSSRWSDTNDGHADEVHRLPRAAGRKRGLLGLSDALRYLPLEVILRTIRDHCAGQVGPCWTARERELSCVADDLGTTLRETRWEVLSP
jgi:hypothetical protein